MSKDKEKENDPTTVQDFPSDAWTALTWVHEKPDGQRVLADNVAVVCMKDSVGRPFIKLAQKISGRLVIPVLHCADEMWTLLFLDGGKAKKDDPDQSLNATLALSSPRFIKKITEIEEAYVIATLASREQLAGVKWDKNDAWKSDEVVARRVRAQFGIDPPKLKIDGKEKLEDDRLLGLYPREHDPETEYPCALHAKIPGIIPPDKDKGEKLCEVKDGVLLDFKACCEGEVKSLKRADVTRFSQCFIRLVLLGMAPGPEGYVQWRLFSAVVEPAIPRSTLPDEETRKTMMMAAAAKRMLYDGPLEPLEPDERAEVDEPPAKRQRVIAVDEPPAKRQHIMPVASPHQLDVEAERKSEILVVLRVLKANFPNGVPVGVLCAKLKTSRAAIQGALDTLLEETEVYCTTDDEHYLSVE